MASSLAGMSWHALRRHTSRHLSASSPLPSSSTAMAVAVGMTASSSSSSSFLSVSMSSSPSLAWLSSSRHVCRSTFASPTSSLFASSASSSPTSSTSSSSPPLASFVALTSSFNMCGARTFSADSGRAPLQPSQQQPRRQMQSSHEWVDRWSEEEVSAVKDSDFGDSMRGYDDSGSVSHVGGDGAGAAGDAFELDSQVARGRRGRVRKEPRPPTIVVRKVDAAGKANGTGRRKRAVARCLLFPGTGVITVNGKSHVDYFQRPVHRYQCVRVFQLTETWCQFDVQVHVKGGGLTGQADAIRHGLAQAMQRFNPAYRRILKMNGLLTRDARVVESKKPGRRKARKKQAWRKR